MSACLTLAQVPAVNRTNNPEQAVLLATELVTTFLEYVARATHNSFNGPLPRPLAYDDLCEKTDFALLSHVRRRLAAVAPADLTPSTVKIETQNLDQLIGRAFSASCIAALFETGQRGLLLFLAWCQSTVDIEGWKEQQVELALDVYKAHFLLPLLEAVRVTCIARTINGLAGLIALIGVFSPSYALELHRMDASASSWGEKGLQVDCMVDEVLMRAEGKKSDRVPSMYDSLPVWDETPPSPVLSSSNSMSMSASPSSSVASLASWTDEEHEAVTPSSVSRDLSGYFEAKEVN